MTQLKTISLKQTETIDPLTKKSGVEIIQNLDTMFEGLLTLLLMQKAYLQPYFIKIKTSGHNIYRL